MNSNMYNLRVLLCPGNNFLKYVCVNYGFKKNFLSPQTKAISTWHIQRFLGNLMHSIAVYMGIKYTSRGTLQSVYLIRR